MNINSKFILYLGLVAIFSMGGYLIYNAFGFNKFHTKAVKIFCDDNIENLGVKNTRSVDALKNYVTSKEKFDQLSDFKIRNFFDDTIRIARCSDALLVSKRYNGVNSVKVKVLESEQIITVLTDHVILLDE